VNASRPSRSRFLAAAAATFAAPYVEWVRPASAQLAPAKLSDIDHIVILMQENRSFDHYYGTLSGVRGYDDAQATLTPQGRPVFYQPNGTKDGYVLPFHLDTKTTSAQRLFDLTHDWKPQHGSWRGGTMDGFITARFPYDGAKSALTMGYHTRDDIPFHYALADAFTICDGYHASVMGPTNPNRYFWMTGTIDPDGTHGGPAIDNSGTRYTWETYAQRLERAGVSWRIYRPEITKDYPVGLDVIMNFAAFQDAPTTSGLYENAGRERGVETLLSDIRTGNLPQVTWIVPPYEVSEHPANMPIAGENYVRGILEAMWSNPATWARTAFIIVYDENDGLFDHVLPPTPPPGTPGEYIGGMPIGLGFRVPCLVISPLARGGYVCSDVFDHTSTLRFIERRFGVEVPNVSAWRRATCGDLTSAFGFGQPADLSVPTLPRTDATLAMVEHTVKSLPRPTVPTVQAMPAQEAAAFIRRRRGSA
jgi:phospholipase C